MVKYFRKWNKEKIVNSILEYHNKGFSLCYTTIKNIDMPLCSAGSYHFGSWRKAIEASGLCYQDISNSKLFGIDGTLYDSFDECVIANILWFCEKVDLCTYRSHVKVCDDRQWTCDFVINKEEREFWFEHDGMKNKRNMKLWNEKFQYYSSKDIDIKASKTLNEAIIILSDFFDKDISQFRYDAILSISKISITEFIERLLVDLKNVMLKIERTPTVDDYTKFGQYSVNTIVRYIGWANAIKKIGCVPGASGERNALSKFTDRLVLELRQEYLDTDIGLKKLACRYNVNHRTIQQIVSGKTWKHVGLWKECSEKATSKRRLVNLTDEQIIQIRKRYIKGGIGFTLLSQEFGIGRKTIRNVVYGKKGAHVIDYLKECAEVRVKNDKKIK